MRWRFMKMNPDFSRYSSSRIRTFVQSALNSHRQLAQIWSLPSQRIPKWQLSIAKFKVSVQLTNPWVTSFWLWPSFMCRLSFILLQKQVLACLDNVLVHGNSVHQFRGSWGGCQVAHSVEQPAFIQWPPAADPGSTPSSGPLLLHVLSHFPVLLLSKATRAT